MTAEPDQPPRYYEATQAFTPELADQPLPVQLRLAPLFAARRLERLAAAPR